MDNNKQKYIQDAMPQKWFEYANELFKSAELIWASSNRLNHISGTIKFCSDTSNTYFLLMGFSLENLLKGVMICENPELLNNTRKRRLASGAGMSQMHVNRVLKQFKNAGKMAKQLSGKGGMKQMQDMMKQAQGGGIPR